MQREQFHQLQNLCSYALCDGHKADDMMEHVDSILLNPEEEQLNQRWWNDSQPVAGHIIPTNGLDLVTVMDEIAFGWSNNWQVLSEMNSVRLIFFCLFLFVFLYFVQCKGCFGSRLMVQPYADQNRTFLPYYKIQCHTR